MGHTLRLAAALHLSWVVALAACSDDAPARDGGLGDTAGDSGGSTDGGDEADTPADRGVGDRGLDSADDDRAPPDADDDGDTGDTGDTGDEANDAMSFFATSVGGGDSGGNYGGLAGADGRCQQLGTAAGAGDRTWRAYLSTVPIEGFGGVLVHARDRIGAGPWFNFDGDVVAADVDALHDSGIAAALMLTDRGEPVPMQEHDILTGTRANGMAMDEFPGNPDAPPPTCFNWTAHEPDTWGFVGHSDWVEGDSWNGSHEVQCHPEGLQATAGSGRLYCFAAD